MRLALPCCQCTRRSLSEAAGQLLCQLLRLPSLRPAPMSVRQILALGVPAHDTPCGTGSSAAPAAAGSGPGTTGHEPVLFVLTPGADPSQDLAACAEAALAPSGNKLHQVALGQGQAEVALALLRDCARTGALHALRMCCSASAAARHGQSTCWLAAARTLYTASSPALPPASGDWLLLKNLHLATAWLPVLEKEVHSLSASPGSHPGFRLLLTSQSHPDFPATLLERCLKVRLGWKASSS